MDVCIFAVYDTKAKTYLPPFFSLNEATAVRAFAQVVNDPSLDFYRSPEDYTLFHIGRFDDAEGMLIPTQMPMMVCTALMVLQPVEKKSGFDRNMADAAGLTPKENK